ncbi:MAG: UvrD-helicase domain-containing protein [Anaerolineales bacterium]|nr:UvrD-helicase domain-containing protein [Anaerolineales bacterium]
MKPTPEQLLAIETQDRTLVVEAGAGTGKTWVLVRRFMHLLENHPDWPLDSILAITFTEKAAREMRTRLRQAIEKQARDNPGDRHWGDHRLNLDRLNVSTIHSLCARILRENAIAAEIDPRFQVVDVQESELLKEEAIRATIQILDEENLPALELLASLRVFDLREEMESMLSKRGTLYQLFTDLDEPKALLSLWQSGLEEMRASIWAEQLREEPSLSEALETLPHIEITDPEDKLAGSVMTGQQGCRELSVNDLIEAANHWSQINLRGGSQANWGGKEELAALKGMLGAVRDAAKALNKAGALQEIDQRDVMAAEHLHLWRSLWERLEDTYSQIKESQQALDFDDLELLTDRLLQQEPRSHRLQGFLDSINHLMVDEFQDTNLVQQRIVYALAPLEQAGKLFVVGDAKQSIYRFRQAQVSIFNRTSAEVETVTGQKPVPLSTSFRTHQSLVQATNSLFEDILSPLGETYTPYEALPGSLTANRKAHPELPTPIEMLLLTAKDQQDHPISAEDARIWEAQWIAQRLLELKESQVQVWDKHAGAYRPFEYRDAAVLFRATTQLPLYEAEFKRFGLPYLTVSGRGYYDRPEVQDLISLLGALANPADDLNLAAALRSPLFSLSDETLYRLRWHTPEGLQAREPIPYREALTNPPTNDQPEFVSRAYSILSELWALANKVEVWTLLHAALELGGYETTLAKYDGQTGRQRSNVQKFLTLARERGEISLSDFLRRLRDLKAREAREGEALGREPESGAVQLMSIHASKGLEFPVVVVADMGRQKRAGFGSPYLLHDPTFGLVCKVRDGLGDWIKPAGFAWGEWLHNRMEEAERKRLLYVACTRAADLLIMSGQVGKSDTWLTEILDSWEIESDGPEGESINYENFAIQVFRPLEQPDLEERAAESIPESPGMDTIPPLAMPVPVRPQPQPVAVTRLEALLGREDDEPTVFHPAFWSNERPTRTRRAPGYLIGNIVHRALAHWGCLEYPEGQLLRQLENYARREGVFSNALVDAVQRSYQMLQNLKAHGIYQDIQNAQRRYHEMPFTLSSGAGILHGIFDLLYQDKTEAWHLLDWKTEWTPRSEIEENAQNHLTQMAAYARAVNHNLGVMPSVCLCFLSPRAILYQFSTETISDTLSEIGE